MENVQKLFILHKNVGHFTACSHFSHYLSAVTFEGNNKYLEYTPYTWYYYHRNHLSQ